jgi:predicted acylesterase/phospholipase RssA
MADEGQQAKLGLALSGGGHRAAFFHIGVLARLAELGRLRGIEVISTVSGGSMVGAAYYLYVKKLLETKPNNAITDGDYIEIVKKLEAHYRQAMAKNLRGLALANYFKNYKLVLPNYSRTNRIAEVLEKEFYRPIIGGSGPIDLGSLRIEPLDDAGNKLEDFDPTKQQLKTAAVPILLLNATTLNTGHSFRFEATWIGEPELASVREADVDKNTRFVRWKRNNLPASQRKTLGIAVASSGCFPGGLAPVAIKGLYGKLLTDPNKSWPFVLKLVDGGVRDNQGIDALLDPPSECKRLIVSDGSAQLNEQQDPGTRLPALLPRVASIEGKESREQRILRAYAECGHDHIAFVHLLSGIRPVMIKPLDGTGPDPTLPPQPPPVGISPFTEVLLAQARTDLDAFSDLEASALMQTGYLLANAELEGPEAANILAGASPAEVQTWRFQIVDPLLSAPLTADLKRHLQVAHMQFFKPFAYLLLHVPALLRKLILGGLAAAILALLVLVGFHLTGKTVPADLLYASGVGLVVVLALYFGSQVPVVKMFSRALFDIGIPFLGALLPFWVFAWAQLLSGSWHRSQGPDGFPSP